jgi:hypothetical protein
MRIIVTSVDGIAIYTRVKTNPLLDIITWTQTIITQIAFAENDLCHRYSIKEEFLCQVKTLNSIRRVNAKVGVV